MSNVRWYAAWAVAIALLIALPIVVVLTHANSATASSANPFAPASSAAPTPSPSPTQSEEPSGGPAPALTDVPLCANVWQDGRLLSPSYTGCQDQGAVVKPRKDGCLVTYRETWWARPGQEVRKADGRVSTDKRYAIARSHC